MKTRTRLKFILIATAALAVCLFAGCKIGDGTVDEYLSKNDAAGQCVTYFANPEKNVDENEKGRINDKDKVDIYYKADSYIMYDENDNFKYSRKNYTFSSWWYVEVDEGGNLIYDGDGNAILKGQVQRTDKVAEGQHLYVVATWNTNVSVEVYLTTDSSDVEDKDGNAYKPADDKPMATLSFGNFTEIGLESEFKKSFTAKNATLLAFFSNEDCTNPVTQVKKPVENDAENVKVYAKFIEGDWTVVKTADDVKSMFERSFRTTQYYLYSTDGSNEIDCSSLNAISLKSDNFGIKVEGNGITISNLKFSQSNIRSSVSVFGTFGSTASIRGLTLKNVTVNVEVARDDTVIYLICHGAEEGASFENFVIDSITLETTGSSAGKISNIKNNQPSCWLFGGIEEGNTDDNFVSENSGITVKDASMKVDGEITVENTTKGN